MTDAGLEALDLLPIPEVAARLRLSVKTVRRRIASGDLQAVREGRLIRVAPEAVLAYKQHLCETALVVPRTAHPEKPAA